MYKQFYVYILANKHNTTLYIGMTNDLKRRVYEHKTHLIKGFSFQYNVDKLVWFDVFPDANSAILREKQLKKWNRTWKKRLINEMNPAWEDLSEEWIGELGDSRLRGNDVCEGDSRLRGNDVCEGDSRLRGNDVCEGDSRLRGNDGLREDDIVRGNKNSNI